MPPKKQNRSGSTKDACPECSQPVATDARALWCDYCNLFFHQGCLNIQDEVFDYLAASSTMWVCLNCAGKTKEAIKMHKEKPKKPASKNQQTMSDIPQSELEMERISAKIDNLTANLLSVNEKLGSFMDSQAQPVSYASVAARNASSAGKLITVKDIQQLNQEEMHKKCLVVVGMPELGNDWEDVCGLCSYLDPAVRPVAVFRLGRKSDLQHNMHRHERLLKVQLQSESVVKAILFESKKLKDSGHYKEVFLRKSMSKMDRLFLAKLRRKCTLLNETRQEGANYKFIVSTKDDKILKYINCDTSDGRTLGKGHIDKTFVCDKEEIMNTKLNGQDNKRQSLNGQRGGETNRQGR